MTINSPRIAYRHVLSGFKVKARDNYASRDKQGLKGRTEAFKGYR